MNRHTKSLPDLPPGLAHDRSSEPAGGYVHEEDRGDMPEGWREVPEDEQPVARATEDQLRLPKAVTALDGRWTPAV